MSHLSKTLHLFAPSESFVHHLRSSPPELTLHLLPSQPFKRSSVVLLTYFEPRSATSRRNTFQKEFAASFSPADIVILAPPYNLSGIPLAERLDPHQLINDIRSGNKEAFLLGEMPQGSESWSPDQSAEAIANSVVSNILPEDVIAILSNGGFGGLHQKILKKLEIYYSK